MALHGPHQAEYASTTDNKKSLNFIFITVRVTVDTICML